MDEFDYSIVCSKLLACLTVRLREVLEKRFGLNNQKPQTLQELGKVLRITRERVRQLERDGLRKLKELKNNKEKEIIKPVLICFKKYLAKNGGAKRQDLLIVDLAGGVFSNEIRFLLHICGGFVFFSGCEESRCFWAKDKKTGEKVKKIINGALRFFEENKKPLPIVSVFRFFSQEKKSLVVSALQIARKITLGPLGDYGLSEWPDVKPRGVREGAYMVLKNEGRPLRFEKIAQLASGLVGKNFRNQRALPQTVHNELIKDSRFVLVGRGIYGLAEWGFQKGTVRDVLLDILKQNAQPLTKQEILFAAQKQRIVKPSTVFLGLGDKKYFARDEKGRYTIRTA
ncbi:MAG: HTH domain-containing protein [Patescibacteria group bacterium]|nr:HTH domain-containing protein [Patescibacteria group bacterium]